MTARPDLAEIERLLEQITPGDWGLCLGGKGSFAIEDANCIAILCQRAPWPHRAAESEANGRLMASAPTTVRALLARVKELEAALGDANKNIEFLRKQSRGHFDAMTAVLRDGVEAMLPGAPPKKAN